MVAGASDKEKESHAPGWRKLLNNAGKLTLGRSVQVVCSLFYLAFATRTLGPENFGKLVLIHTLCLAVTQLARFESWQTVVRFGASARQNHQPRALHHTLTFAFLLDALGAVLGIVLYAAALTLLGTGMGFSPDLKNFALVYGIAVIVMLNSSGAATGLLQLLDRFGSLAKAAALEPLIRLLGAASLFFGDGGVREFLILWFVALAVSHILTLLVALRQLALCGPEWSFRFDRASCFAPNPGMWHYAFGTFWVGSMNVARDHLPTLAVGVAVGPSGAGLLKVARQFSDFLTGITTKLLVPALFSEFAHMRKSDQRALLARLTLIAVSLFLFLFLALTVFGSDFIRLIAGNEFLPAYGPMLCFAFAGVLGSTSFGLETLLASTGAIRRVLWANTASLVVYLASLFVLLSPLGIMGVGVAALLHALLRSILLWRSSRKGADEE